MKTITEKYSKDIRCVLSCYDRILIDGTLPELNHAKGMTDYLYKKGVKIFDYGKCLHYYFYFKDEKLGYGFVRVPTWCPFRLQVYVNGHSILENKLKEAGIKYTMIDNAFDSISDIDKAQQLADEISPNELME